MVVYLNEYERLHKHFKENIISALRDKGVDVNDDAEWYELDDKIEQIEIATGAHPDWNQNGSAAATLFPQRKWYNCLVRI